MCIRNQLMWSQLLLPFNDSDAEGKDMTTSQDTPVASDKDDTCIQFNMDVYIQKALESLPPGLSVAHIYPPVKKYLFI